MTVIRIRMMCGVLWMGVTWYSVPVSGGHFSGRRGHQAVSYGGSLWVIGGRGSNYLNDVWRSADGENWVSVSVSGGSFFWAAGSSGGFLWW